MALAGRPAGRPLTTGSAVSSFHCGDLLRADRRRRRQSIGRWQQVAGNRLRWPAARAAPSPTRVNGNLLPGSSLNARRAFQSGGDVGFARESADRWRPSRGDSEMVHSGANIFAPCATPL